MSNKLFADRDAARPRGIVWRLSGVLLLGWAVFAAISLATYFWKDIPTQISPPNRPAANWLGIAGAWHAYAFLLLCGGAVWTFVAWLLLAGGLMVSGLRLRLRWIGMLLATLAAAGLLQAWRAPLSRWAGPEGVNLGGNVGGAIGELVFDRGMAAWLGHGGAAALLGLIFLVGLIVAIGPRALALGIYSLRVSLGERRLRRLDRETLLDEEQAQLQREMEKRKRALSKDEMRQRRLEEREAARLEREAAKSARQANKKAGRREREEQRKADKARLEAEKAERGALFQKQLQEVKQEKAARKQKKPPKKPAEESTELPIDEFASYKLPGIDLLNKPPPFKAGIDDSAEKSETIVHTLKQFGIEVEITDVVRGPAITRYELLPAPGIKVSRITGHSENLQMNLRAKHIRILAPIPGQGVMGIEIPNAKRRIVTIREVAEADVWHKAQQKMALPCLLGKDVANSDVVIDLARMPHLLIAGATGSGKSACINAILTSLLLARRPDELRLLLVDPKRVELMPYAELPHLVVPVITEPNKVGVSLQWAISEMTRRLNIFSKVGVRNIADFNKRDRAVQTSFLDDDDEGEDSKIPDRLPYIVILIDEIADLMLIAQAEIENRIARLAQLSRAAGIHMILATQRPSVNIITGTIKANFPGRIAFQVTQKVDSRTILDASGADALIGQGDMLIMSPQHSALTRAQGAWVSDAEIQKVVATYKAQGKPVYEAAIKERLDKVEDDPSGDDFGMGATGGTGGGQNKDEALIPRAIQIIRETRRATTSSLQRRLGVGYNRAANVMDMLESRGIIGPAMGNEPREILVDLDGEMPEIED